MIDDQTRRLIEAVRAYADLVLRVGKDRYTAAPTSLLVDAVDVETHRPAMWIGPDGRQMAMCNPASQQTLLRTLVGLSALTGEMKYHDAALAAVHHALEFYQDEGGLLHWGGHRMIDLITKEPFGSNLHELRCHYPFYELMWQADPLIARRFIESFWDAHVLNWSNLDLRPHGHYGVRPSRALRMWQDEFRGGPISSASEGNTAVDRASDLYYAAGVLHRLHGDPAPLQWARRLARRNVETRSLATGLSAWAFSQDRSDPTATQFSGQLAKSATDVNVLDRRRIAVKFGVVSVCNLFLAESLGNTGDELARWTREELVSLARHGYDPHGNTFRAMLIDGTPLSPSDIKQPGRWGAESFLPLTAGPSLLWAYAKASRLCQDDFLRQIARDIAAGNGLGDIGDGASEVRLADRPATDDPLVILALVELHAADGKRAFLDLAARIAERMLTHRMVNGLFSDSPQFRYARLSRTEPLALLHLAAALMGRRGSVPQHLPGEAYFTGPGFGRKTTSDYAEIYPRLRHGV